MDGHRKGLLHQARPASPPPPSPLREKGEAPLRGFSWGNQALLVQTCSWGYQELLWVGVAFVRGKGGSAPPTRFPVYVSRSDGQRPGFRATDPRRDRTWIASRKGLAGVAHRRHTPPNSFESEVRELSNERSNGVQPVRQNEGMSFHLKPF